jgi:hypothetical protein
MIPFSLTMLRRDARDECAGSQVLVPRARVHAARPCRECPRGRPDRAVAAETVRRAGATLALAPPKTVARVNGYN